MRLSFPRSFRFRVRQLISFAVAAILLLLAAGGTVAEAPTAESTTESGSTTISDVKEPSREAVVSELIEIRRRLGGSIVSDREMLRNLPPSPSVDQAEVTDYPTAVAQFNSTFSGSQRMAKPADSAVGTVDMLRDAAWQLLQSAETLERSELYKQADALRSLAQQFRLDARALSVGSDK